jgi:hypothetical protein
VRYPRERKALNRSPLPGRMRGLSLVELLIWGAIIAGIVATISFAVWSIYKWIDSQWETSAGITEGERRKDAEYRERDAKAILAVTKQKAEDDARVRAAEANATAAQSAAASAYEKGKIDGKNEATNARDRLRSGALVLRDPGAKPCPADVPRKDGTSPGAGRGVDGRARAELSQASTGAILSRESSEWLVEFASEADEVAKQLRAAQKGWRSCVDLSRSGAK